MQELNRFKESLNQIRSSIVNLGRAINRVIRHSPGLSSSPPSGNQNYREARSTRLPKDLLVSLERAIILGPENLRSLLNYVKQDPSLRRYHMFLCELAYEASLDRVRLYELRVGKIYELQNSEYIVRYESFFKGYHEIPRVLQAEVALEELISSYPAYIPRAGHLLMAVVFRNDELAAKIVQTMAERLKGLPAQIFWEDNRKVILSSIRLAARVENSLLVDQIMQIFWERISARADLMLQALEEALCSQQSAVLRFFVNHPDFDHMLKAVEQNMSGLSTDSWNDLIYRNLIRAIDNGDLEVVKKLLNYPSFVSPGLKIRLVTYAVSNFRHSISIVEEILAAIKASGELEQINFARLLTAAAEKNSPELAKLLLKSFQQLLEDLQRKEREELSQQAPAEKRQLTKSQQMRKQVLSSLAIYAPEYCAEEVEDLSIEHGILLSKRAMALQNFGELVAGDQISDPRLQSLIRKIRALNGNSDLIDPNSDIMQKRLYRTSLFLFFEDINTILESKVEPATKLAKIKEIINGFVNQSSFKPLVQHKRVRNRPLFQLATLIYRKCLELFPSDPVFAQRLALLLIRNELTLVKSNLTWPERLKRLRELLKQFRDFRDLLTEFVQGLLMPLIAFYADESDREKLKRLTPAELNILEEELKKYAIVVITQSCKVIRHLARFNRLWHSRPEKRLPPKARPLVKSQVWYPRIEPYYTGDNDNGAVIPLYTPQMLSEEGKALQHCVGAGGYVAKCREGSSCILSVRNDSGSLATVELVRLTGEKGRSEIITLPDDPSVCWTVAQFRGERDGPPPERALEIWQKFKLALEAGEVKRSVKIIYDPQELLKETLQEFFPDADVDSLIRESSFSFFELRSGVPVGVMPNSALEHYRNFFLKDDNNEASVYLLPESWNPRDVYDWFVNTFAEKLHQATRRGQPLW